VRAGPFSNDQVIDLLNRYYVPIHVSIDEYYFKDGTAPGADREELRQIVKKAWDGKPNLLPPDAHCYVLAPDGQPIDNMGLPNITVSERMMEFLERNIRKLKTPAGEPLVKPAALAATPPRAKPDALVLHLTARYLPSTGAWGQLPAEDWIVLERNDWTKLLGPEEAITGTTWDVDKEVATKLLTHFYPPSPNTNLASNRFDQHALRATLVSVRAGVAQARIEGNLRMKHFFLPRQDDHQVEATVFGFVEYEAKTKKIRSVRLVTEKATYGKDEFGVAVRSVPE
jgi:hypothetical protein